MEIPKAVLEWRKATAEDEPFIFELTYGTMRDYLIVSRPSTEEELTDWLKARNAKFRWFIALLSGTPIGAFAFSQLPDRINIDSVHVLPEKQNQGLGTEMLLRFLRWADKQKLPVALQVMKNNSAARRLYERLGFAVFSEDERFYHLWRPVTSANPATKVAAEIPQTAEPASREQNNRQDNWFRRLFFRAKT